MNFRRKNIRLHLIHYRGRGWFFVTICCESRRPVFSDHRNAEILVDLLKMTADKCGFGVHAFCVMPDHFHALVEGLAPTSDLLRFLRNLKQASSREYRKRAGNILWQKKFYDHILRSKDSPEAVAWYIWMNPVRKGLCTQPNQHPFAGTLTFRWDEKKPQIESWLPPWKKGQALASSRSSV
jgi:putative transposase